MRKPLFSLGLTLAVLVVVSAAQAATPTLTIPKLANAPTVDGQMTPGKWADAAGISGVNSQFDDGRIVTAWYSSAVPGVHERYHMGAAVWSLPAGRESIGREQA
jgi:hypothetical protein